MSYRLSEVITAINAALNYPAITYEDVALFLDQCIGEINTTLHTGLRTFKDYKAIYRDRMAAKTVTEQLDTEPTGDAGQISCISSVASATQVSYWYYYVGSSPAEYNRKFVHCSAVGVIDRYQDTLYGIYVDDGDPQIYEAHPYSDALCLWVKATDVYDFDVTEFLPDDWITLFLIPYVCFKYTVRDGGIANTFAEEMEQGFQQLQEAYDVPHEVFLPDVAGMPAYTKDVEDRLDKGLTLNVKCITRAIRNRMRHARNLKPEYGSMYDAGGFGL